MPAPATARHGVLATARVAVAAAAWLAGSSAVASAQPMTLTACEALVRADSSRASSCYPKVVQTGQATREAVTELLTARLASHEDPQIRLALAMMLATKGDPAAEAQFRAVSAAFAQSGNRIGGVLAGCSLSNYLMRRGRVAEAVDVLAETDRIAAATGDPILIARVRNEQAWGAYRQADYGRAMRLLKDVETVVRSSGDARLQTTWLSGYGANLWALGRSDEALATYKEEAALHRATGNRYDEATALSNIVLLSSGPARHDLALEAARIAHEAGNLPIESSAYFYLSEVSPPREAREYAQRSLDIARRVHAPDAISKAQGALAMTTLPFDAGEAFRLIDGGIDDARSVGDPNQAVRLRFIKANMRWTAGPREAAIADSHALLDAIERLRAFQPEADVRAARFSQWRFAYYRLAGHVLARHLTSEQDPSPADFELAFATLERMRSRMLLDRLDAAGSREPASQDPLHLERQQLLRKIADTNRRLTALADGAEKQQALRDLEALESRAADAAARLARADPEFGMVHVPALSTLDDVRAALHGDEALITYQTALLRTAAGEEYGGWIWIVTKAEIRTVPLPTPDRLDAAVDLFNGLIERGDNSEGVAAARLYKLLIAPALETLGAPVAKLIVIPDDMLYRLPFDALREAPAAVPLGVRMQITLAPSATTWLRWRQPRAAAAAIPALVLADPTLPSAARAAGPMRDLGAGLAPLPEARSEGLALIKALGGGSRIFAGAEATETALKSATLSNYRILHFAAHAVIDDLHPERSAVILAPGDGADDGYLQAREIAELHLNGQLILLSSCRSAGGSLVPGEGVLGLAHAFFRAGARSVIGTLWPIRDDQARQAFELIGRQLGQGTSVAAAVAAARATLHRNGVPASAWASLVVMGDGEFVPLPGGRRWQADAPFLGAIGCAAMAATALIVRIRTRRRVVEAAVADRVTV